MSPIIFENWIINCPKPHKIFKSCPYHYYETQYAKVCKNPDLLVQTRNMYNKIHCKSKEKKNKCWWECGEREPSHTVRGNVNEYNHYEKQYGGSSKN
jgi:hypothetical protein